MRPLPPKLQATLTLALSLIAAVTLTLLASGAFAHTGADGGTHHDDSTLAHHLFTLEAWLATLNLEAWVMLPPLLALCVWLTVRWLHKKSQRTSSARRPVQSAQHRKDQT